MSAKLRGALLLLALFFTTPHGQARADDITMGPSPIVNVQLTGGSVTVRTWNRPQVRITTDGRVDWNYFTPLQTQPRIPAQIDSFAQTMQTLRGSITLPAESFILPQLPGIHDAFVARGFGNTTIVLPQTTALVVARIAGQGSIKVSDYHGTLVADTRMGVINVERFAGTAYMQVLGGRIFVADSTFDRVRARLGVGPVVFEDCSAKEIDETSIVGAVVYDNGSFAEGPAHFASEYGNVAVGVGSRDVQLSGHSGGNGSVFSDFGAGAAVNRPNAPGDAIVTIGSGGPVVTASSAHGSVYMYRGMLSSHPQFLAQWPRAGVLLQARGAPLPPARFAPPPRFARRPPVRIRRIHS